MQKKNSLLQQTQKYKVFIKIIFIFILLLILELLAKITFLQEAPKMEIANLLWYRE